MRISKSETPQFENYEVWATREIPLTKWSWSPKPLAEYKLGGVLEADDVTGRLVQQIETIKGEPIYTNGLEDIFLSNEVKILLLVPPIKAAFIEAGFIPKVIVSYEKNLRIVNKNPTVEVILPPRQQVLEAEDAY